MIFLLAFLSFQTIAQPLNGLYTIGGISPDYIDFTSAVTALNTNGVSGPVVFNVRPGIYNQQIRIMEFVGSSAESVVTFQSETGIADDVILSHRHGYYSTNYNYTIFIDGADNMKFRNMTIRAAPQEPPSGDNNRVVYITHNSDHIWFENNSIESWFTTEYFFAYNDCIFIGMDGAADADFDDIRFIGNRIFGGFRGLSFRGNTDINNYASDLVISNNIFSGQSAGALKILNVQNIHVSHNQVYAPVTVSYYKAIETYGSIDSLLIDGNYIRVSGSATGIDISNVKSGNSGYKIVSNNMIIIEPPYSSGNPIGIKSTLNDSLLVAYNAISINIPTVNGYSVGSFDADTLLLLNNHLVHNGGGLCYFNSNSINGAFISDYNNVFNGGAAIANLNGIVYPSVSELYTLSGKDEHSLSVNPLFQSDILLLPYSIFSNNAGIPLLNIGTDYFGNSRSLINTDIGVLEDDLATTDAGISQSSILNATLCSQDSFPIYVSIKNFGSDVLESVDVYYQIQDIIYSGGSWSGSLTQFQESTTYLAGYISLQSMQEFDLKLWTENPNGSSDQSNYNDTLELISHTSMSGIYSIGDDSDDDFIDFTTAVAALEYFGICDAVTFNVDAGIYTEHFVIHAITGSSEINTITFQSIDSDSSSVIVQYLSSTSSGNYVVQITGASFIHFRNLTIKTLSSSYQNVVALTNSSNITFSYVAFKAHPWSSSIQTLVLVSNNNSSGNNMFQNCRFERGGTQLSISNGIGINTISGNLFTGNASQSINLYGQNGVIITNNIMEGGRSAVSDIQLNECDGKLLIEKNKMNIVGYNMILIKLEYCQADSINPSEIKNNFIYGISSIQNIGALSFSWVSNVKVTNNNFNFTVTNNTIANFGNQLYNIDFYNNIFNCSGNGRYYNFNYPIDTSSFHSDFNSFYTNGVVYFSEIATNMTYADWRILKGLDLNSIFTIPQYVSNTDLHVNNSAIALNGAGKHLPWVLDDIDGEIRDLVNPDIGADEFTFDASNYIDIELSKVIYPDTSSCIKVDSLVIQVTNHSSFVVNNFIVKWWLFDLFNDSMMVNLSILPHDSILVNIAHFNFVDNTLYKLKIEASEPNFQHDNYFNDNSKKFTYTHMNNVKIFQRSNPLCTADVELFIKNFERESVLWSTGSTDDRITVSSPGTYSVAITDENGCTITESIVLN